jgi:hypothetical protein
VEYRIDTDALEIQTHPPSPELELLSKVNELLQTMDVFTSFLSPLYYRISISSRETGFYLFHYVQTE